MADSFSFELVSPEQLLISEKVTEVVLPASEGEMTVMAHHAPVMTTVKPGVVTVKSASGSTERYVVFGGFADIVPSGCTLLAESALHVKDFDRSALDARIETAKAELSGAVGDESRTGLEQFLSDLTALRQTVFAG